MDAAALTAAFAAAVPMYLKIQTLRRYDGTTPVESWLRDFAVDLDLNALDTKWAIQNLDRVLLRDARSWWVSRKNHYTGLVTNANKDKQWTALTEELKSIFGGRAIRAQAKIRNKAIRYTLGDDPQRYVMQKLEVFASIDPSMGNEKKLEYLIAGLPTELISLMSLSIDCSTATPSTFLDRLRVHAQHTQRGVARDLDDKTRTAIPTAPVHLKQEPTSMQNQPAQQRRTQKPQGCSYCHKRGHQAPECYKKADDEGRPRPQPKARRSSAPRAMQVLESPRASYASQDNDQVFRTQNRHSEN